MYQNIIFISSRKENSEVYFSCFYFRLQLLSPRNKFTFFFKAFCIAFAVSQKQGLFTFFFKAFCIALAVSQKQGFWIYSKGSHCHVHSGNIVRKLNKIAKVVIWSKKKKKTQQNKTLCFVYDLIYCQKIGTWGLLEWSLHISKI